MPTSSFPDSAAATGRSDGAWRLEVGRFRAGCPQRTFPLGVHVGVPAGPRHSFEVPWPVPEEYDEGLRFDLLLAVLVTHVDGPGRPSVWLTRQGLPSLHDQDALWHATATRACEASSTELAAFRVVTKAGWLDVRTGESRTWTRLRL